MHKCSVLEESVDIAMAFDDIHDFEEITGIAEQDDVVANYKAS